MEVDTRRVGRSHGERVYWFGHGYRGLLLGHVHVARDGRVGHSYFFGYDDCARYQPGACGSDLQVQEVSVCSRSGQSTLVVLDQPHYPGRVRAFAAHGLLFVDIGQRDLGAVIGATHVRIFGRVTPEVFGALREFGKPAARLPAPALPRALLRRLHRTERAHASSGSVGGAARGSASRHSWCAAASSCREPSTRCPP